MWWAARGDLMEAAHSVHVAVANLNLSQYNIKFVYGGQKKFVEGKNSGRRDDRRCVAEFLKRCIEVRMASWYRKIKNLHG